MIEATAIATNRYAPAGSEAINLYSNELAADLTLGQLVQAVCVRTAAAYEAQSIIKMNMMTGNSQTLDTASGWMRQIADGSADWDAARTYLTQTLGIPAESLPQDLLSYDKRMSAIAALKEKVDVLVQQQQEDMIDLQTMVNRRDVAFSTSSNITRTLGQSMAQDAANFLRG